MRHSAFHPSPRLKALAKQFRGSTVFGSEVHRKAQKDAKIFCNELYEQRPTREIMESVISTGTQWSGEISV
jgi:hypothetical protein